MAKAKPTTERRESPSGYHFYYLYRECPRKWLLKYVYGLIPRYTPIYFIRGGILHDAQEAYFRNDWNLDAGIKLIDKRFHQRENEFEHKDKIPDLKLATLLMFNEWHEQFREEKQRLKLIEFEKEHEFKIGPNKDFDFTVRMDRVFYDPEIRTLILRDTKTTSWSTGKAFHSANQEDQMTAYLWAAKRLWPKYKTRIVEIDALYHKGKVTRAERKGPIYRTDYALARFELELYGTIYEVSQKYFGLEEFPESILFPRNGRLCSQFDCEYKDICRTRLKIGEKPIGFKRDSWYELRPALTKAQESFNIELITKGVKI